MNQSAAKKTSKMVIVLNKIKTYFSKPQNIILLLFGIVLTFTTVAPVSYTHLTLPTILRV